jgi:hypothetical protein
MITKRYIVTFTAPFFAIYVARELGTADVGRVVCSLDEEVKSGGARVLFRKGNPILGRFNILMRR